MKSTETFNRADDCVDAGIEDSKEKQKRNGSEMLQLWKGNNKKNKENMKQKIISFSSS